MLRDYQRRSIDAVWLWLRDNTGNPCLVLPPGAGKSHVVAAMCKEAIQGWPDTRILMLTHVKELIEQNAEKMREHWPGAPMGIYSASLGKRVLDEPITFAGVQSVAKRGAQIGHIDLVIIDECHLVSHEAQGGYRKLLAELQGINPQLRVIGLTATPWRLGHGLITDKPAIFDALIEPVNIEELVIKGFLSLLRSRVTELQYDMAGIGTARGDYVEAQVQARVDTDKQNAAVVNEVIALAGDRKAWLFFCAGVGHAEHVAAALSERGIAAACVTGDTPRAERRQMLADFRAGRLRALTNANVLTTGFDYPDIDLIAMLRPTESPVLYMQMAGRGLRPKSHTDHCLVLDFAGVVAKHGPIVNVEPPSKKQKGGKAPTKVCPSCGEINHASARKCTGCGAAFAAPEPEDLTLHHEDIMGDAIGAIDLRLTSWTWRRHKGTSGKEVLAVTYYGALSDRPVTEYLPVLHDGYAGEKAWRTVSHVANALASTGHALPEGMLADGDLDVLCAAMTAAPPPLSITYRVDGKFFRVISRKRLA